MDSAPELHALFAAASQGDSAAAAALMALQGRRDPAIIEATLEHLDACDPALRAAAAEVAGGLEADLEAAGRLGQLIGNRLLLEKVPAVLAALCAAAGRFSHPELLECLVALGEHADPRVREGVAFGLMGREDDRSLAALIALSADLDAEVRTWATYGLGAQTDLDAPALRAALIARLDDAHPLARHEAIAGLARRDAPEAVLPLARALADGALDPMLLEAAATLGEPALRPGLIALRSHPELTPWLAEALDEALARCDPDAEV